MYVRHFRHPRRSFFGESSWATHCHNIRQGFSPFVFLLATLMVSTLVAADETVVVTEISGQKSTGTLKSWSDGKLILAGESLREIPRVDVRSITFERPLRKIEGGQPMILLSNGDRIVARPVSIINDTLKISWTLLDPINAPTIPLEKTAAVVFELPLSVPERLRLFADIETLPPGSDLVLLVNGDRATGELQQLNDSFVELTAAANLLKLDRSRVRAIRLNPELTNATRFTGRRTMLSLIDGSRISATNLELSDGKLKLKSAGIGNLAIPLDAVCACQFFGERVIPLTDLEPAKIEFTPFLSGAWVPARNTNVLHGPLTLRGKEYSTGLGMHSQMSVTYNLRGSEQAFQCIVGIDDVATGAGSASFAIELDGSPVWTSLELTSQSNPVTVPEVDLRGHKQLKLIVNFGQFADVADYANWCDPILILAQ